MPTEAQLVDALTRADKAGDHASAQEFAGMIKAMRAQKSGQTQPFDTTSPANPPSDNASSGPGGDYSGGGGGLYAAIHGYENGATLGFGDKAAALVATGMEHLLPGKNRSYSENLADIKARAAAADNAHPIISTAANVAGAVPTALAGGEAAAALRATRLGARAGALASEAPAALRATGRVLAAPVTGAAMGATQGYNDSGTVSGAETGAAFGAAGGSAGAIAGRFLAKPASAAFNIIARHVRMPGETLAQASARISKAFDEYVNQFGTKPSVGELLDHTQGREIAATIQANPEAQATAAANEDAAAVRRQGALSDALKRNGQTDSPIDVRNQATQRLDKVMGKIGDNQVPIAPIHVDTLTEAAPVLKGPAYAGTRQALEDVTERGATSMSVRDLENIRTALARGAKNQDPVTANHYGTLRDNVRTIAEQDPDYMHAMGHDYAPHMRYAENIEVGRTIPNNASPEDVSAAFHANDPTERVGIAAREGQRTGLRGSLANAANESPNAAVNTARDLSQNAGLQAKVRSVMAPAEAADVIKSGDMAYRAAQGQGSLVTPLKTKSAQAAANTAQGVRAATLGLHGGSSSFLAHNIEWLTAKLSLPRGTAKKLAELSSDPNNTSAVMQYLKARGGSAAMRREYLDILRKQATGAIGGAALAGNAAATTQGQ